MSVFDSVIKKINGTIAHDAVDSGNPVKIGGKASASVPAAVAAGDRADAFFDLYGRMATLSYAGSKIVELTPAVPAPAGSDILDDALSVIVAGDLTIRDTNIHAFFVPMSTWGYRSLIISLVNGAVAWDQPPVFTLWGCTSGSGGGRRAILATFTGVVTDLNFIAIGMSQVGQGGLTGSDPVPGMFYYYPVPAMADGWPYLALYVAFGVAPTQGEFLLIDFSRMT